MPCSKFDCVLTSLALFCWRTAERHILCRRLRSAFERCASVTYHTRPPAADSLPHCLTAFTADAGLCSDEASWTVLVNDYTQCRDAGKFSRVIAAFCRRYPSSMSSVNFPTSAVRLLVQRCSHALQLCGSKNTSVQADENLIVGNTSTDVWQAHTYINVTILCIYLWQAPSVSGRA